MKVEFFTGDDGKVWFRTAEECLAFAPSDYDAINYMLDYIKRVLPAAYARLAEIFADSFCNRQYFHYRIVARFIRCNMGDDNHQRMDVDEGRFNLERVSCPLRGICKDEGVVCSPKPCSSMTGEEQKAAVLYSRGFTIEEIARLLNKSFSTVNNQLCNVTKRLGLRSRHEVIGVCRNFNLI